MNIGADFPEELSSSPKDCPCSERLSSIKKTNQPHLDTEMPLLGPVSLRSATSVAGALYKYENYWKVNDQLSQNSGAEPPAWLFSETEGFAACLT